MPIDFTLAALYNYYDVAWVIIAPLIWLFLIAGIIAFFVQRKKKKRNN